MEIRVNTDNMRSTATVFQEKINDWNSLVQQLWSLMEELDAMWDGDANEAFNALVTEDKPKFERLAQMMETYKTAIDTAASKYDSGEAEVKNIVSTR
jgi:WXG100 family type VII secretion target